MVRIRWTGNSLFSRGDRLLEPGDTIDVAADEADDLLSHWSGGWERADRDSAASSADASDDDDEDAADRDQGDSEDVVEPTPTPDDIDVDEDEIPPEPEAESYTRDELESMEWAELRQLAVNSDDESINGQSKKGDIIDALAVDGADD